MRLQWTFREERQTITLLALSLDEGVDVRAGYDMRSRPSSAGIPLHDVLNPARELTFSAARSLRCVTTRPTDAAVGLLLLHGTAGAQGCVAG